jgi:hypothetical protein
MLLNSKSRRVAFGGIGCALSLLFLIVASTFPFCRLAFVFASSYIVGLTILNYDIKNALIHYLAVTILSIFIVPAKQYALLYAVVVGNYPVARYYIDRIKRKYICFLVKFIIYNIYIYLCYKLASSVLDISFEMEYPLELLWVAMILAMYVYDYIYNVFMHKTLMFMLKN